MSESIASISSQGKKQEGKKTANEDSLRQPRRRSLRQSNNLLTTKHLSRFHQLFWKTDLRNSTSRRLRKRQKTGGQPSPEERHYGRLVLEQVNDSPHIYVIDNFLTETELLHLHKAVIEKSKFQKSFVDGVGTSATAAETLVDDSHRTSTFVSLTKQHDSKVSAIERKAADLLGLSPSQIEPLQLVRYQQGQFFGVHHDLGNLAPDGTVEVPLRQAYCKRRLATIFCYLNDVDQGGCTYFPAAIAAGRNASSPAALRVQPKRGRAVLFCNLLQNGDADPLTIHAGEPVVRGSNTKVKYGLNIWACEE